MRTQTIKENLEIVQEFIHSDDYSYMVSPDGQAIPEIKEWIESFLLHHKTFNFFFELDPLGDRTFLESNLLADRVCKFLGYDQSYE